MWKANIPALLRRLTDRYRVEPGQTAGSMKLLDTIQPVSDTDELRRRPRILKSNFDISVNPATLFTVPEGKRWRVHRLYKEITIGSTMIRLYDRAGGFMRILPNGTGEREDALFGIIMEAGWYFYASTTTNGADTSITFAFLVEEEDSF